MITNLYHLMSASMKLRTKYKINYKNKCLRLTKRISSERFKTKKIPSTIYKSEIL